MAGRQPRPSGHFFPLPALRERRTLPPLPLHRDRLLGPPPPPPGPPVSAGTSAPPSPPPPPPLAVAVLARRPPPSTPSRARAGFAALSAPSPRSPAPARGARSAHPPARGAACCAGAAEAPPREARAHPSAAAPISTRSGGGAWGAGRLRRLAPAPCHRERPAAAALCPLSPSPLAEPGMRIQCRPSVPPVLSPGVQLLHWRLHPGPSSVTTALQIPKSHLTLF